MAYVCCYKSVKIMNEKYIIVMSDGKHYLSDTILKKEDMLLHEIYKVIRYSDLKIMCADGTWKDMLIWNDKDDE